MKDKTTMVQALVITLVIISVAWELTGYLTGQQLAETPKRFLAAVFLCWLIFTIFRRQQDDDDLAGQY